VFLFAEDIITNDHVQIYRTEDKPYYHTGNRVLMALSVWSMAIFIIAKIYYVRRNKYVNPCPLIGRIAFANICF
jgi:hypothetical protein